MGIGIQFLESSDGHSGDTDTTKNNLVVPDYETITNRNVRSKYENVRMTMDSKLVEKLASKINSEGVSARIDSARARVNAIKEFSEFEQLFRTTAPIEIENAQNVIPIPKYSKNNDALNAIYGF